MADIQFKDGNKVNLIRDVSFIVITYNEEFGVKKCLTSISELRMENCEVICVDSGSTDSTIEVIHKYKEKMNILSLFQIKGYANAAIGRNIGIKKSTKNLIYFIDGDVEIKRDFLLAAIDILRKKQADAVTGKLAEYQYNPNYKSILAKIDDRYYIKKQKHIYSSGGIFITKRFVVNEVGCFNENFVINEDLDFTLRLSAKFKMLAINELMGIHHTIPYHDWGRLKNDMISSQRHFGRLVVKNMITNKKGVLNLLWKNKGFSYGFLFYVIFLISLIFYGYKNTFLIFFIVGVLDILYGILKKRNLIFRVYTHYFCPLLIIMYALIPKGKSAKWDVIEID